MDINLFRCLFSYSYTHYITNAGRLCESRQTFR
uniref:Uncharacterized protein n=1 Tax=Anguilla anguilla TaxID=7936 RepID=A0A0E9UCZ4_ANGAN